MEDIIVKVHLRELFNSELKKEIKYLRDLNAYADILSLEDCQTCIKPSTVILGAIKRSNEIYYNLIYGEQKIQ